MISGVSIKSQVLKAKCPKPLENCSNLYGSLVNICIDKFYKYLHILNNQATQNTTIMMMPW